MVIIPARLESTRFKKKMLHPIRGIPMVVRTARRALEVADVVVATDDASIVQICKQHHIHSLLTSKNHLSGSDRIAEAVQILGLPKEEIVVNVQGDEPFIEPEVIAKVQGYLKEKQAQNAPLFMASAYKRISFDEAKSPDCVKVVVDSQNYALYFSRSLIPFVRDDSQDQEYLGHLGIYAYSVEFLINFCALKPTILEKQEKLEQLRALHYGYHIGMVEVHSQSFGIDTEMDLQKALSRIID